MSSAPSPTAQTTFDRLAEAWLRAGATTVSLWDHQQLIRHWPVHNAVEKADFVTPIRLGDNAYGEMRICGFGAPDWTRWNGISAPAGNGEGLANGDDHQRSAAVHRTGLTLPDRIDVYAGSRPAMEVGGDYYDFVYQESGDVAFSVVDVAGKGMSAAMYMPGIHGALRRSLQSVPNTAPDDLVKQSNQTVFTSLSHMGCFATALVGRYEPSTRIVTYANAGHAPVMYRSASGDTLLLAADTVPLGIQEDIDPIARTIRLEPGDIFVVTTDGFVDAKDLRGNLYGYQRLLKLIDTHAHRSARAMVRTLFERITDFAAGATQNDDQTVIVLKG